MDGSLRVATDQYVRKAGRTRHEFAKKHLEEAPLAADGQQSLDAIIASKNVGDACVIEWLDWSDYDWLDRFVHDLISLSTI